MLLPDFCPQGHLSEGCCHTHLSSCFLPLLDSSLPALSSPWDMSLFFLSSAGGFLATLYGNITPLYCHY